MEHRKRAMRIRLTIAALLLSFILPTPPNACINSADKWSLGIVFNNGEVVDITKLDRLGRAGIDVLRSQTDAVIQYSFQSHFAPGKAMVFVSAPADSGLRRTAGASMIVFFDSSQATAKIDFATAVRVELDWLDDPALGVLDLTCETKSAIEDSVRRANSGNRRYFTRQRMLVPFNCVVANAGTAGERIMCANSTGCGFEALFAPPPQALRPSTLGDDYRIDFSSTKFSVRNLRSNVLTMVDAIKETNGGFYYPFMSRTPEFMYNVLKGYFEIDSVLYTGPNTPIFVTTGVIDHTLLHDNSALTIPPHIRADRFAGNEVYDVRGRLLANDTRTTAKIGDPAGVVLLRSPQKGAVRRVVMWGNRKAAE
jgi:hypothetical protein